MKEVRRSADNTWNVWTSRRTLYSSLALYPLISLQSLFLLMLLRTRVTPLSSNGSLLSVCTILSLTPLSPSPTYLNSGSFLYRSQIFSSFPSLLSLLAHSPCSYLLSPPDRSPSSPYIYPPISIAFVLFPLALNCPPFLLLLSAPHLPSLLRLFLSLSCSDSLPTSYSSLSFGRSKLV